MDLWTQIANLPGFFTPTRIGVGVAMLVLATAISVLAVKRTQHAETIITLTLFVVFLVGFIGGPAQYQDQRAAAIGTAVAQYLADEYDLVTLAPVAVSNSMLGTGRAAEADAVDQDGTVVTVTVEWVPANSRPVLAGQELPDDFSPVTVTIDRPEATD